VVESGLRERKKLESWRAIRAAALRLVDARGFEAVSIDDIARAANVSRTTFFNYFASKEAVVFDPDPEDREALHALMAARPAAEPLWASLQAIMSQNMGRYADRLPLQKKLKAASPKLAASARDVTDEFGSDLREWVASRTPEGAAAVAALQVNVALAVAGTAYEQWNPERPFSELVDLLAALFASATAGFS
jgi:AcrR family transcriptional regulator